MTNAPMICRVVIQPDVQRLVPPEFESRAWEVFQRLPRLWDQVAAAPLFRPTAQGRAYIGPRWVFTRGDQTEMLNLSFEEMLSRRWPGTRDTA